MGAIFFGTMFRSINKRLQKRHLGACFYISNVYWECCSVLGEIFFKAMFRSIDRGLIEGLKKRHLVAFSYNSQVMNWAHCASGNVLRCSCISQRQICDIS